MCLNCISTSSNGDWVYDEIQFRDVSFVEETAQITWNITLSFWDCIESIWTVKWGSQI